MDKYKVIIKQYLDTVNLFNNIESDPRDYGSGDILFSSEIDTLSIIGNTEGINLTELSKKLGISKSGTSKFVNHLIDKKLIQKGKKPNNKKEVIFKLTKIGRLAYKGKKAFNQEIFNSIFSCISNYVDEDLHVLSDFFDKVNEELSKKSDNYSTYF